MITFKQFLLEGGAATAEYETQRATKADIIAALKFVAKHTGIGYATLEDNLLGSTKQTLSGAKKDSGDLDIAVELTDEEVPHIVEKMRAATQMKAARRTGEGVYSFAVPTIGDKRVQVDLMVVPSIEWAKFGYHAEPTSKYKGVVRNTLIDNLMKRTFEEGKDFVIKDDDGREIIRVRRGFLRDKGLKRMFHMAPMRKDGKGRVGSMSKATPAEIEAELKRMGVNKTFSKEADSIMDPDRAASYLFPGKRAKDMMSAEQVIKLIAKRKDAAEIFKDTIADLKKFGVDVPDEIKQYE